MRRSLDALATWLLVLSAISLAAVTVHRQLNPSRGRTIDAVFSGPPTYVPDWTRLQSDAVLVGDSSALVKVIEFADFECPACRRLHLSLKAVERELGASMALYYVHYPLPYHRFARPAARAAECAANEGRFGEMHDLLFAKQDSLGLKSWTSYAAEVGISDTAGFRTCVSQSTAQDRVERGLVSGDAFGVQFTPTLIINGWRFASAPRDSAALSAAIAKIVAGTGEFAKPSE